MADIKEIKLEDRTLPEKLSMAIRVALADLERCEADPRYEIDMGTWHEPVNISVPLPEVRAPEVECTVCLAGAAIAGLGYPTSAFVWPKGNISGTRLADQMLALDCIMRGLVEEAVRHWAGDFQSVNFSAVPRDRVVSHYHINRVAWKRAMHDIADELEAAGF